MNSNMLALLLTSKALLNALSTVGKKTSSLYVELLPTTGSASQSEPHQLGSIDLDERHLSLVVHVIPFRELRVEPYTIELLTCNLANSAWSSSKELLSQCKNPPVWCADVFKAIGPVEWEKLSILFKELAIPFIEDQKTSTQAELLCASANFDDPVRIPHAADASTVLSSSFERLAQQVSTWGSENTQNPWLSVLLSVAAHVQNDGQYLSAFVCEQWDHLQSDLEECSLVHVVQKSAQDVEPGVRKKVRSL